MEESPNSIMFVTPETKVNKNILPFGPFRKSRIPVLIKNPQDNKPCNIQLVKPDSAKAELSYMNSTTNSIGGRDYFKEEIQGKSLRKLICVENCSLKRNRDLCRPRKKLDCIKDQENYLCYFPSYGSNPLLVDWDSRLKNSDPRTNPRLEDDVLFDQTAKLLEKISDFYSPKGNNDTLEGRSHPTVSNNDDSRQQACVDLYVDDILRDRLEKEVHYCSMFKSKPTVAQEQQRKEIIKRVARLGLTSKVPHDIIHSTVCIIDAFLQKCTSECCALLTVAAFFIAIKLESQTQFNYSLEKLVRLSNFKYHEEVRWMERFILHKLSFDICPPTSQFFLELCISQLDFPNEHIKSLVIDLSSAILIRSISDIQQISLKASLKAQTAALIATEYVMFNKNTIMKRFGVLQLKKIEYSLFFESAVTRCYKLFRTLIMLDSENALPGGKNTTPTLDRNRNAKGMLKLASSSHCILVK